MKAFCGRYFCQVYVAISGAILLMSAGVHVAWTSPYLPKITDPDGDEDIKANSDEASWCAIVGLFSSPIGTFVTLLMADRIGRKLSLLTWAPLMLVVNLWLAFAKTITELMLIRFLYGIVEGGLFFSYPMYLAEISDPAIRGKLSGTIQISYRLGMLLINVIGPWTSIFTSSLICAAFPIVHFAMFAWVPESPYFYLKKKLKGRAEESLKTLRGEANVEVELNEMAAAVKRQEGEKPAKIADLFTVPSNRKALIICATVTLTCTFSGKYPVMLNTLAIFSATGLDLHPSIPTIIYYLVEIATCFLIMCLVDKFGRRPLVIISTTGCAISLALEGVYFYLQQHHEELARGASWLSFLALIAFIISFCTGLAFGPILFCSELFPSNVKVMAVFANNTFFVVSAAAASKLFAWLEEDVGMYLPFWFFSACCLVSVPLLVKILPETKGKTLEEIQVLLIGAKDRSEGLEKH